MTGSSFPARGKGTRGALQLAWALQTKAIDGRGDARVVGEGFAPRWVDVGRGWVLGRRVGTVPRRVPGTSGCPWWERSEEETPENGSL